ncbi:MAG: lysophospholipid acyltransferase family protein [Candidatus Omnitrophica bacterium]|nr:lysophospholipid acyltransferase family protein [Candidatus Omnitrophota bacterium]
MNAKSLGYRLAQGFSLCCSSPSAFRIAERLSDGWARMSASDRQTVHANLSLILGAPLPREARLIQEVFRNFGRYLVEFFTIHRVLNPDVRVEGYDHLLEAARSRRGTIVLTGHLGNWELGGVLLQRMGFPISVVALPHDDVGTNRLFNRQRARCGLLEVIPVGRDAVRRSLQSLRQGRLLGVLGDREFFDHGVSLTTFGTRLTWPLGPAILSLRSHAPVVPTFLIREGQWKFRLCFEPPIWPAGQTIRPLRKAKVLGLTQTYAAIFERYIRHYPDQWLNFQPIR